MSAVYNLEPQPTAKVVLSTTAGDISLELFAKQTPLASRNFLQHCLDGYYNGTIFHRLVPGFIIQGGDPTGTGQGGAPAINNGKPFEDEMHSRLKFNRRGLLGMANDGRNSNESQFFLTLGPTLELQGKHTLFGRVEGDSIFNLVRMGEAELEETEGSERPMYPTKITGAEVLVNPFEDMVAKSKKVAVGSRGHEAAKKEIKKRKKPAVKNVLSFAGGDDEEEELAPLSKKARVNTRLVATVEQEDDAQVVKQPKERKQKKARSPSPEIASEPVPAPVRTQPAVQRRALSDSEDDKDADVEQSSKPTSALDRTNAEIAALKAAMRRNVEVEAKDKEKSKSVLETMIPDASARGRRRRGGATEEKGGLDVFATFKHRLGGLPADLDTAEGTDQQEKEVLPTNGNHNAEPSAAAGVDENDGADVCDLHFIENCQSCKTWEKDEAEGVSEGDGDGDGDEEPVWMGSKLTFARDMLGKDLEWKKKMEELEIIDPHEKAKSIRDERRKEKRPPKR